MEKLTYSISKEYSHELNEISHKLEQIEKGRVYELSGAQMDGYLATNAGQLKKMFANLLNKIQNGEEGTATHLADVMRSIK